MRVALLAATALSTTIWFVVPHVAVAQSTFDWSGAYVGATLGVVSTTSDLTTSGDAVFGFSTQGALAGLTVGYNQQLNEQFVIGIEADGSLTTVDGSSTEALPPFADADERLDSLLTLRGRLGVTNGPVLAYGTLGLAGGNASYSALIQDFAKAGAPAEGSGFVTGVVGGAGVEVAVNDSVSIKTEGLMYSLSPLAASGDINVNDEAKGAYTSKYTPSGLVVRTGVNVHF
ncbi:MAG: outer membrane protein [Devosia sp.]